MTTDKPSTAEPYGANPHNGEEFAWLIELSGHRPAWWDGRGPNTFTTDPNDVFRMARREDAERALHWKLCIPPAGEVRIIEHGWMGK